MAGKKKKAKIKARRLAKREADSRASDNSHAELNDRFPEAISEQLTTCRTESADKIDHAPVNEGDPIFLKDAKDKSTDNHLHYSKNIGISETLTQEIESVDVSFTCFIHAENFSNADLAIEFIQPDLGRKRFRHGESGHITDGRRQITVSIPKV